MNRKKIKGFLALFMVFAVVTASMMSVFAANHDIYLDRLESVSVDTLQSIISNKIKMLLDPGVAKIIGPSYEDGITVDKGPFKLTEDKAYTVEINELTGFFKWSWVDKGTLTFHKKIPVTFYAKSNPEVSYHVGMDNVKQRVFDAIFEGTDAGDVTKDNVTVYYNCGEENEDKNPWQEITKTDRGHVFGTQEQEQIVFAHSRKDGYDEKFKKDNLSDVYTLKVTDPRVATHIAYKSAIPDLELGTENYVTEIKKYLYVAKPDESEAEGQEVTITFPENITMPGEYNGTASYGGVVGSYKPAETINFTVKVVGPYYTASVIKDGNGTVAGVPQTAYFTDNESDGFTVTATPDKGCYTESIQVKVGNNVICENKMENTLEVPANKFANKDACEVYVTFKEAEISFEPKITINNKYRVTLGTHKDVCKQAIFDAAYKSSKPSEITASDIKVNVKKKPLLGSEDYYAFDSLQNNNRFGGNDIEDVRIAYEYNGKTIYAYTMVSFEKTETEIVAPEQTLEFDEGDSYLDEIKKSISVKVKDGEVLQGAQVDITGFDANIYDEEQTLTINYKGDNEFNASPEAQMKVKINAKSFTVTTDVSEDGTVSAPSRVALNTAGDSFDFTVTPKSGCYFVSVSVTKNNEAQPFITKTAQDVDDIKAANTFTVNGPFENGDTFKIDAVCKKAEISLNDTKIPAYLKHNNWKYLSIDKQACEKEIFDAIYVDSTPNKITYDDVDKEKGILINRDWGVVEKPESIEYGLNPIGGRDTETVRVKYNYNNEGIIAYADVTFEASQTQVTVPEQTVILNEGDSYEEELKKLISVTLEDGRAIKGATVELSGFDGTQLNKEQTVTATYKGVDGVFVTSDNTFNVKITPNVLQSAEVISVTDDVDGKIVTVKFTNYNDTFTGDVMLAAYDENGKLCEIVSDKKKTVAYGTSEISFKLTSTEYPKFKFMIWDSVETMSPVFKLDLTELVADAEE